MKHTGESNVFTNGSINPSEFNRKQRFLTVTLNAARIHLAILTSHDVISLGSYIVILVSFGNFGAEVSNTALYNNTRNKTNN